MKPQSAAAVPYVSPTGALTLTLTLTLTLPCGAPQEAATQAAAASLEAVERLRVAMGPTGTAFPPPSLRPWPQERPLQPGSGGG